MQTPVLAMIVGRDDEIRTFKPEPFWELLTRYREVTFKFAGERFPKEEDAQALLSRVHGHLFVIAGVERKEERVPPLLLAPLAALWVAARHLEGAGPLHKKGYKGLPLESFSPAGTLGTPPGPCRSSRSLPRTSPAS